MSMLDAQHRARRRRVEASLLASLMLALTVAGATVYVAKLATVMADADALFTKIG